MDTKQLLPHRSTPCDSSCVSLLAMKQTQRIIKSINNQVRPLSHFFRHMPVQMPRRYVHDGISV